MGFDRPDQKPVEPTGQRVFVTEFGVWLIYDHEEVVLYRSGIFQISFKTGF
jgi:hypothetical protein